MQTVRTTITFPEEMHQQLMIEAVRSKKTLSDVVVKKLLAKSLVPKTHDVSKRIKEGRAFFDRLARMGEQIDAVKVVREERDRDNA